MKIVEFANSVDPDGTAHNEQPHRFYTICHLVSDSQSNIEWTEQFFFSILHT